MDSIGRYRAARWILPCSLLLLSLAGQYPAWAGGPLLIGGPDFGVEGEAFIWDPAIPVEYRVDGGPLSTSPDGTVVVDNVAAVARVEAMFQVWQDVPTAAISYSNAGAILSVGVFTDGDVSTAQEFDAVAGSCETVIQNPVVFDADGSLFAQLVGDPNVVGFAGTCSVDSSTGRIVSGLAALNGRFLDGVDSVDLLNFELTSEEFDATLVHEFGHFSGLDHSQVNVNCLDSCPTDDIEGLPTMFPILLDRTMRILAPDDVGWISRLYPDASFSSSHGMISGLILFSDGITQAQGVNVVARQADNSVTPENESRRIAVSVVSGFRFTGNPGQSVTADYLPCMVPDACPGGFAGNNSGGSPLGSRDPLLIGYYEIPVPAGDYTIEVESINPNFVGGSGLGPLDPPIPSPGPNEKWNLGEAADDLVSASSVVTVTPAGHVPEVDVILNETERRFDALEGSDVSQLWWPKESGQAGSLAEAEAT